MAELIYHIDKVLSEADNTLVLKIQLVDLEGFTIKSFKNQERLTKERLLKSATLRDGGLLPFLIKEETTYAKKNLGRVLGDKDFLDIVHVNPGSIDEALKLLTIAGKLYFNNKHIVIDLYGKSEFYYTVDSVAGKPHAKGNIKTSTQDFPIDTCDLIGRGSPPWFIKGSSLKILSTDISWKDFKAAYESQTRLVTELIEEANEDPAAPRVILNDTLVIKEREPLPVLLLQDRLGAFADLWLDYGEGTSLISYHDHSNTAMKDGKPFCKRQTHLEQGWEKDLLETDYIKKAVGTSHYYCPLDKVSKSIAFLIEIGWQVRDINGNRVLNYSQSDLIADSQSSNVVIKGKLHFNQFSADVSQIVGAFNRRQRFAEIAPGHVALLPNSLDQIGLDALVEEGEIVGSSIHIPKNRFGTLSGLFEAHPQIGLDKSSVILKEKLANFQGISTTTPGERFKGILRTYQQAGLDWLIFLYDFGFHGMLADDMGLGKTVQVLSFISTRALEKPILIVVPTSLIFNWKKEIEKFLPDIKFTIHHGPTRTQSLEQLTSASIILTTYTTARLDFTLLSQLTYDCLILDEAQAIKNANTQTSQALTKFHSHFRLSITGTPIENSLTELWSHFHFLIPDLLGDESSFNAEMQAGLSDPRYLKRIKKKIRPFLLRRRKEEVAKDLPEKIEQTVWIEMEKEQRQVYEGFLSGVRRNLIAKVSLDGVSKHRMEILESIMRLRQICCHPLLVNEAAESAKLDAVMEDLETALLEGRKILVYSQFTSMLSLIGKRLKEKSWRYAYLDGSTQNREKVVTEFQEDPSLQIFLISLKAGGIGLNLTAADYVFLYDPWWNAAVENQAIDRAHRIGRKDTVIAKRYIMTESIEEKIMKLKAAKSSLSADILDDEAIIGTAFTADDVLYLLT